MSQKYIPNINEVNCLIIKDLEKLFSGEINSFELSGINNYDWLHISINNILGKGNYLEIDNFNGWNQDFYYEFSFSGNAYVFYGSITDNSYTIDRM